MSYKPKYCCECGGKVERIDWKFWHSGRFCELCETDFKIQDLLPYLKGSALPLMLIAVAFFFQKPEKPLNVSSNQLLSAANTSKNISANREAAPTNANIVQTAVLANNGTSAGNLPTVVKAAEMKAKPPENLAVEASEKVYFCGAATKKGTPCSRRVRGGGRCWQHVGQTAMLAQDKLLAEQ